MNNELLLIDLLGKKEQILAIENKNKQRLLAVLFGALVFCAIFFFGLASLVYRLLLDKVHLQLYQNRLTHLRDFSWVTGGLFMILLLLVILFIIWHYRKINSHFQDWLLKKIAASQCYQRVLVDDNYYYLLKKGEIQPRIRVAKITTSTFNISEEKGALQMAVGHQQGLWGVRHLQLFFLDRHTTQLSKPITSGFNQKLKLGFFVGLPVALGLLGVLYYSFRVPSPAEYLAVSRQLDTESNKASTTEPSTSETAENLPPTKASARPNYQAQQDNELYLETRSDELYLTVDHGKNWQLLPVKGQELRFGQYLLTTGEIPNGYFMDKTYDVSAKFSWLLAADITNNQSRNFDIYFLTSKDGGKTWQKHLLTDQGSHFIRYRKVSFFNEANGVFVFSTSAPEWSQENLFVYSTNDGGNTWQKFGSSNFPSAIQNISFLNQMTGFVATREKLYYTTNAGSSYKEATIQVPEGYALGGLDVFQSPNEVSQKSSTTLEATFYLTKVSGHVDAGKMFACLYQSTDNGQNWQFVDQKDPLTKEDY